MHVTMQTVHYARFISLFFLKICEDFKLIFFIYVWIGFIIFFVNLISELVKFDKVHTCRFKD